MGHPFWPLFDLEVRTPRLTLVYPDESMLVEIVRCAERGIHDPATMPFGMPWTDAEPPEFQRSILQHHWKSRAELTPDEWSLPFAVVVIFGATLSFLTPIGYQTNTIVWAMGGYRYTDFARLGLPVTILVLVATPVLVPIFFPFH